MDRSIRLALFASLVYFSSAFKEICNMETYSDTCSDPSEVLFVTSAFYGRMRIGRCMKKLYERDRCERNVTRHLAALCSGRKSCSYKLPDDQLYHQTPCPRDVTPYLEIVTTCQKIYWQPSLERTCRRDGQVVVSATERAQFLASAITSEYEGSVGTRNCPWLLRAPPGRRVNLTLWDFNVTRPGEACTRYATVIDRKGSQEIVVCSGQQFRRHVLLSETPELTIVVADGFADPKQSQFFLEFQGAGCSELVGSAELRVLEQDGATARLECRQGGATANFRLRCAEGRWIGDRPDCVKGEEWTIWSALTENWATPLGIAVVIGLGAALGVVVGFCMLCVALAIVKRRRKRAVLKAAQLASCDDGGGGRRNSQQFKYCRNGTLQTLDRRGVPLIDKCGAADDDEFPPPPPPLGCSGRERRAEHVYEKPN